MMNSTEIKGAARFKGEAALLFMTIIWGGTFVIVKESLSFSSPIVFILLRFSLASIVLGAIMLIRKSKIQKEGILPGIFLGVIIFFGFFTQTIGLSLTTATKSGFITGSLVVMIPFFQMLIEKKFPSKGAIIGTVLVFFGILFLSSGGNSITSFLRDLGSSFNLGDMLTVVCAAFFAIHVVYIDVITPKYDFSTLLFMQLLTVAIMSLIGTLFISAFSIQPLQLVLSKNLVIGVLYTALLATMLNYGLQTKFQKVVTPTKAGIIYSFEPIFAALFAFFLLSEKITTFGLVGCSLIFLGLIVAELFDAFMEKRNGKLES